MTTAELLADLDRLLGSASAAERPALALALTARLGALAVGMAAESAPKAPAPTASNRASLDPVCLSIATAAALMEVSEDYMAKLARQGKVPTVRLPALTRGKGAATRTPEARALRIPYDALKTMITERTKNGLDKLYSTVLYSSHDGSRGPKRSQAATAHAGRAR